MNIPQLPAENIYKFIALAGVTLVCFASYLGYESQSSILVQQFKIQSKNDALLSETEKLEKEIKTLMQIAKQKYGIEMSYQDADTMWTRTMAYEYLRLVREFSYKRVIKFESISKEDLIKIAFLDNLIQVLERTGTVRAGLREAEIELRVLRNLGERGSFYDKYIIILLAMGWLMTVSGFFLWYKIRQRFEDKLLQNAASGESR